ncbi:hypothetical protein H0O02_05365, partial [Candidatus Micrarchaeota archaeon]|nr:hypothetical protein [Candidatus Micrarchaeota archaeon]
KWLLWDVKWEKTELGVMKRMYGHFKNSWEEVQGKDREGKLELLARRIWFGTRLAALSTTVAIAALAYVPYAKNNDFIRMWRQQIHVSPFQWGKWELAYPNFRANPFTTDKGWDILNKQDRNKEREAATEITTRSMVNDLFKNNLEKGEHEQFMLQFCYSGVTRKNIDSKQAEPELKAQLEWLTEHPEVEKFLLERRYLKKIGKITVSLDKVKYDKIKDAVEKAGWTVTKAHNIKGGVSGYSLQRLALMPRGLTQEEEKDTKLSNEDKDKIRKERNIADGLKLNKNKTKQLVAELMQAEAKGTMIDGNYMHKNLRMWEKEGYFVPKMIEAYMNTYGVKDPKTAELLIASPEMAQWIGPMVAKGHAPVYIKEGKVERIVEMLKYKIEASTGKIGLVPLLPQDEMIKKQILADVMVWAGGEGVLGDCMDGYAKNVAVERLKKELGVYCPKSPDTIDYVLGAVTAAKTPEGKLEITTAETEMKRLLASYHGATATKSIIPEQLDDFVRAVKEHAAAGGKISDFDPVNGVMLEWAEQYGYLRPLLTKISTSSGDVYVSAESVGKGGVTEKIMKGSEGALAMAGGMLEGFKTEKSYKDLFAKEDITKITAAINAYLLQEIAKVYNGDATTGADLGIKVENDEVEVIDADKFKKAVVAGLNVIKKNGMDALAAIQAPALMPAPAGVKPGEPMSEGAMTAPAEKTNESPYGKEMIIDSLINSGDFVVYQDKNNNMTVVFKNGNDYQIGTFRPGDAIKALEDTGNYKDVNREVKLIEKDGQPVYELEATYTVGINKKYKVHYYIIGGKVDNAEKM